MKAVYRRDPRLYYGPKKTRGWIPTLQTQVFGQPVCDPSAVLTAIEAEAALLGVRGRAVLVGANGKATTAQPQGKAQLVGVGGRAEIECS